MVVSDHIQYKETWHTLVPRRLSKTERSDDKVFVPVLQMDKYKDLLDDTKILSTFNLNSRYRQVEIGEQDRNKTELSAHNGLL